MRMLFPGGNFALIFLQSSYKIRISPTYDWVSQEVYFIRGLKAKYCSHI